MEHWEEETLLHYSQYSITQARIRRRLVFSRAIPYS
jgi:hypothetical protein